MHAKALTILLFTLTISSGTRLTVMSMLAPDTIIKTAEQIEEEKGECKLTNLGNMTCDQPCNTPEYEYDGMDCHMCNCFPSMVGDGQCNLACRTPELNWDGGDCPPIEGPCICEEIMRGDGHCDCPCNTEACNWDGGDCQVPAEVYKGVDKMFREYDEVREGKPMETGPP